VTRPYTAGAPLTDVSPDNELETVVRVAKESAAPSQLAPGSIYVVVTDNQIREIDLTGDEHREYPRRKTGSVTVRDAASFQSYWDKHRDESSEIYADRERLTIEAILDAHGGLEMLPGWRQHRVTLALKYSPAFTAWHTNDGREMTQEAFAEFLEDNRLDIFEPAAAEMLEVAQSIQATTKVDFASGFRLTDGQRRISYTENVETRAGQKGELAIPTQITLRVPIFEGAEVADELMARFRHRINNGRLMLAYKLDRPRDVVTAAFDGVVAQVAEATQTPVLRGTPA
jgi:uncharacterized protein YfdQ (DUF2303 family)